MRFEKKLAFRYLPRLNGTYYQDNKPTFDVEFVTNEVHNHMNFNVRNNRGAYASISLSPEQAKEMRDALNEAYPLPGYVKPPEYKIGDRLENKVTRIMIKIIGRQDSSKNNWVEYEDQRTNIYDDEYITKHFTILT